LLCQPFRSRIQTVAGIGLALTGAAVGELVGASSGLGWYITNSLNVIDMTGAVMAVLAMLVYWAVLVVERRLLAWWGDARTGR